jgi:hypothetical protein
MTDGREGLRVFRILNACQQSLEGHKVVYVTAQPATARQRTPQESASPAANS